MTTLAELRALVRAELGDTTGAPLWPDERLDTWVREAIREYGRALPRRATVDLVSVRDEPSYALPADVVSVLAVEYPVGDPLGAGRRQPGDAPSFEAAGGRLTLAPAPTRAGEPIRVRYGALYPEPTAAGDVLATPPADDDLLVMAAATRALRWLWTAEAKSLRYVSGANARGVASGTALELATGYSRALESALSRRQRQLRLSRLSALGP